MDRAGFRDYVFPLDHPRVARLQGKDAHAHAQIARGDPRAQERMDEISPAVRDAICDVLREPELQLHPLR
jgi:hypothetical protein